MTVQRKVFPAAAAAAAAVLALAATGCGGGADDGGGSAASAPAAGGALVIWADAKRAPALEPFAAEFGAVHGVTVTVQAIAKDQQAAFVTASQQGSGPDVMVGAHDWIGNLVRNGAIDPVPLADSQKAAFSELSINAVTFNGQVYGVPYAQENLALIRNARLAPTAPTTIEELVADGRRLKASGKVREILCLQSGHNGDAYHIYPFYTAGGGYLFGTTAGGGYDPKDLGVGKPGSVAAFRKIKALGEKGAGALKRSITGQNSIAMFAAGKCAYLVSGPWAIADTKRAGIAYDISAVPGFAGGQPARPFVGVQAFYVAAKGKNKALAQEFVANYVTTADRAVALYHADPRPPALTEALERLKGVDPDLAKFRVAGAAGLVMPAIPEMAAILDRFGKAVAAVIGGADVVSTVAATHKAISAHIPQ